MSIQDEADLSAPQKGLAITSTNVKGTTHDTELDPYSGYRCQKIFAFGQCIWFSSYLYSIKIVMQSLCRKNIIFRSFEGLKEEFPKSRGMRLKFVRNSLEVHFRNNTIQVSV